MLRWMVAAGVTGEGTPRPCTAPAPTVTGKGTGYWLPTLGHYGQKIRRARDPG